MKNQSISALDNHQRGLLSRGKYLQWETKLHSFSLLASRGFKTSLEAEKTGSFCELTFYSNGILENDLSSLIAKTNANFSTSPPSLIGKLNAMQPRQIWSFSTLHGPFKCISIRFVSRSIVVVLSRPPIHKGQTCLWSCPIKVITWVCDDE